MPVFDSYTKTLLHFNGPNDSTFYRDEIDGRIWTPTGGAKISTATSKFGGASGYFDGSDDYISTLDSDDWYFADAVFTVDFWFNTTQTTPGMIFYQGDNSGNASSISIMIGLKITGANTGKMEFVADYGAYPSHHLITSSSTVNDGAWHHCACLREETVFRLYIDGLETGTAWDGGAYSMANSGHPMYIGTMGADYNRYNGYLDELRVSKGVARWTETFPPPLRPYGSEKNYLIPRLHNRLRTTGISLG